MNRLALLCFAGFVFSALVFLPEWGDRAPPERRKFRVSLFLVYALAASFGAGLVDLDLWPFSSWPLVAGTLPEVVTQPRLMGVDSAGVEYNIDTRAWEPLSFDEFISYMDVDFLQLDPAARDRLASYLLATVEAARARAATGRRFGRYDRFLGPFTAPLFLLHPRIWSDSTQVPLSRFVGLRFYRETWNLELRARGQGTLRRRLLYQYPAAP